MCPLLYVLACNTSRDRHGPSTFMSQSTLLPSGHYWHCSVMVAPFKVCTKWNRTTCPKIWPCTLQANEKDSYSTTQISYHVTFGGQTVCKESEVSVHVTIWVMSSVETEEKLVSLYWTVWSNQVDLALVYDFMGTFRTSMLEISTTGSVFLSLTVIYHTCIYVIYVCIHTCIYKVL